MASQIILAWRMSVGGSSFGSAQAVTALGAVPLYENLSADPILGQLLGLTVASDATVDLGGGVVQRTLTLNMASPQAAPPAFPCRPVSSTPPELPLPLRKAIALPGSFFVQQGSVNIATTMTQLPSIPPNSYIQFLSQLGVFYQVLAVGSTSILLATPYSGATTNTGANKEVATPVTKAAIYSTSPLDTNGVATSPSIPAGPGAQNIILSYKDSTGAGPFTMTINLTGKRPAQFALVGGSVDIAEIDSFGVGGVGSFGNSVGQITLVELTSDLPAILSNRTADDFPALTDEAQMLIKNPLVYLPPSYFALAQQGNAQTPSPTPPTSAQLSSLIGQFVAPEVAMPPLKPPLNPSTVPIPTFLSGFFTQTLQLALAVPVAPQPIAFA
jgi:hypothetical protein